MASTPNQTPPAAAAAITVTIPKSYELYVEGAKWIVAIVAGLLAFGLAALDAHPGQKVALVLFTLSAVALALAGAAALVYLLYSYTYAGLREAGTSSTDDAVTSSKKVADLAFPTMLWTFGAGILLFAAFEAAHLWGLRTDDKPVVAHLAADGRRLVIQRGDRFWLLSRSKGGKPVWLALPTAPQTPD